MKSYEEQLEELKKDLLSAFTVPDAQSKMELLIIIFLGN